MTPTTTTDGMKVIGNKEIITKKKDGKDQAWYESGWADLPAGEKTRPWCC